MTDDRRAAAAPATEAQREIFRASSQSVEASLAYNEAWSLRLLGALDASALKAAWSDVVARHDALRLAFTRDGSELRAGAPAPMIEQDLSSLADGRRRALEELLAAEATTPFDLVEGPLVRTHLVRLAADRHVLVLGVHHSICDDGSALAILRELAMAYGARVGGGEPAKREPAPSFADWARAQHAAAGDAAELAAGEYWLARFRGGVPVLDLPLARPRPRTKSFASAREDRVLEADFVGELKRVSAKERASLFTFLLAGFSALLHRLSGQDDLVIGVLAGGQAAGAPEGLVGHCINTLPIRVQPRGEAAARELTQQVGGTLLDAFEHQPYPLPRLVEQLALPRDESRLALVSVAFNFEQGFSGASLRLPGLQAELVSCAPRFDPYDLFVNAVEADGRVTLECRYNSDLFDAATIARWLEAYEAALRGMTADPGSRILALPILPRADRTALEAWNGERLPYPADRTVAELIEEQARRTPDAVAVEHEGRSLTFAELDRASNRLAHRLRGLGVKRDVLVGLCLDRSLDLLVGLVAILKAGGGYVPLDPSYPADRLGFMAEDSALAVLLTQESLRGLFPTTAAVLCIDADADAAPDESSLTRDGASATPDSLAYVIYTSGSTGKPKGVQIPNRCVVNLLASVAREPGMTGKDVVLAVTTLSFDIAVAEVILPLTVGARIVLVSRSTATDGAKLASVVDSRGVTFVNATPSTWRLLLDAGWRGRPEVTGICTGEAMPKELGEALLARVGRLWNGYGPTETTVWSTFWHVPAGFERVLIGRPVANTQIHVLDAAMQPVPVGVAGEIYIGGDGVTLGYLNRPELTRERFLADPFRTEPGARIYRTGDVGRYLADGTIECLGRNDNQVKLRGFRIELGEIEAALAAHAGVKQAVVALRAGQEAGDQRLVAWIQPAQERAPADAELREHLRRSLPDFMLPQAFVAVTSFPLTPSGKVDRKALPDPTGARPELAVPYAAPRTATERAICEAFAQVLGIEPVGVRDGFFELGGNSLLAHRVVMRLREKLELEVPVVRLFEHPAAEALAAALDGTGSANVRVAARVSPALEPVAIVGMACRLPGARNVEEFWRNVRGAKESITFFRPDELDPALPASLVGDPSYVKARGIIDDFDLFDAAFFGITPAEAEVMDPQHRVFLELAWEALESAGCVPETFPGLVGVFGGIYTATYHLNHVLPRAELVDRIGEFNLSVTNEKDYVATRVAYKLNLTGPAISIHTACSTSLVAVAQAFESLRSGQCDLALAGGVAITSPPRSGYVHQEGAMLSPDGHTRSFDAKASGTVFSDGAAIVVLKRLSDAVAHGDRIHGVLLGAAVNNDGGHKASFTAPSVSGQSYVIARAQALARVEPRSIGYVEAHGTGTPLGDPIELEALTRTFRSGTADRGFCALGSVKTNVGHTVTAAGAAGLIKTALALRERVLPPSLHFESPNPRLGLEASPFYVNTELRPWPEGPTPRRAGVSSFGVGGTNAHVVVEEPPAAVPGSAAKPRQLLVLSARSEAALAQATANLASWLEAHQDAELADVAYTLQVGRRAFRHRRALVAETADEARKLLEGGEASRLFTRALEPREAEVAFLLPGQGAQSPNMGLGLYRHDRHFREAIDRCAEIAAGELGRDLRELLYPAEGEDATRAAEVLRNTTYTQPAIFAVEYAMALAWQGLGVRPRAFLGHSLGEFVAAVLASVWSLEDALRLVITRGRLMQALPPGSMLSVREPFEKVSARLPEGLDVATVNGPSLCVVSGPTERVLAFQKALEADGVAASLLQTSHAFHSAMMDPVVEPFAEVVRAVRLAPPKLPILSAVTGDWLTAQQATDPLYWASHLRRPVMFSGAVTKLLQEPSRLLLEVGPRATLATLARQHVSDKTRVRVLASLGEAKGADVDWASFLSAAGQLWLAGVPVDFEALHHGERRLRVPLPTYPFERKRFWLPPVPRTAPGAAAAATAVAPAVAAAAPAAQAAEAAAAPPDAAPAAAAPAAPPADRKPRLVAGLRDLMEQVSGIEIGENETSNEFLEMGLDSLTLTQVAQQVQKSFGVKVAFRQLMETLSSVDKLAHFLDEQMPPEPQASTPAVTPAAPAPTPQLAPAALPAAAPLASAAAPTDAVQRLIDQQLAIMQQQLAVLAGARAVAPAAATVAVPAPVPPPSAPAQPAAPASVAAATETVPALGASTALTDDEAPQAQIRYDVKKAFGAIARINTAREEMTPRQRARLEAFVKRYTSKTRGSKEFTQRYRRAHADPRSVTGFRPAVKELVYPIVVQRSKGPNLWDIDGNQYVDALNGFGCSYFGWQPEFITEAVKAQIDLGIEIGPQPPVAAEVAELFCEYTGAERAAFCNTGSEAVMGCLRVARTVTGRDTVVLFANSYHGIFDEVVVRGNRKLKAYPAAPGIVPNTAQNVLVLDYGTPESLEIIRARASEFAAVLVEPVQSRRPDFQPREFLRELRTITERSGTVLIFDEVICGLRAAPGGAQEHFGVRADLASYGKVIGGGYPIGVVAGKARYMDALDGGHWQYGDDSVPPVGVTYFAGTFCRHPLALAAAKAVLLYLREQGPGLQKEMNERTEAFAARLNAEMAALGAPLKIKQFSTLWKAVYTDDQPWGDLLFYMLRDRGVHIYDGFPCFLTTAHDEADIAVIVDSFRDAVIEMQSSGFLPEGKRRDEALDSSRPPVPGARLGRDENGAPAWFVASESGKFVKVG
jgi:amino acid adenylation domain-containing protein